MTETTGQTRSADPPTCADGTTDEHRGGTGGPADEHVRWLTPTEQASWRNWVSGSTVLWRSLERELQQAVDITMDDYALMVLLSEADGRAMRMSALADEAIVPRPQVTYRVSRLEKRGLVERRPCDADARGTEAHLTDEGFALLERAARRHVTNVRELFLDHLTDDEFATLGEAMGRVHEAIADGDARRA